MGGICERGYRDSMARVLELGTQADTELHEECVAVVRIITLQPQHARVDVRHQRRAAENVSAESPLGTLCEAAVGADRRETRKQHPQLGVEASPRWIQRRLIPGGKQDGVGTAVARTTGPHAQRRIADLQPERPALLLVPTEPHAHRRATTLERPTERR